MLSGLDIHEVTKIEIVRQLVGGGGPINDMSKR